MLKKLMIKNIALVEDVELDFNPGLTVLTGETGAGKSVIVNALALILGERADREYIRHGADSAEIEAVFDIDYLPPRYKKEFAEHFTNDKLLIVKRELSKDGNSKIRIKDTLSTLTQLKELTSPIAEIIGQHANQMLMNEDNHLFFLDYFGSLDSQRETLGEIFKEWDTVASKLKRTVKRREQLTNERELLLFQKEEIEKAQIKVGEEEELISEKKKLDSALELMTAADTIREILDGEENSVINNLRLARKQLEDMAEIDKTLEKLSTELTEIDFQIEDIRSAVERYGATVQNDPERLEEINLRLDEIYKLKKKYGGSEEAVLKTLKDIVGQLGDRPNVDALIEKLEKENKRLKEEYTKQALALTDARHKTADYLAKLVVKELAELAIDNGGFKFTFIYQKDPDGIGYKDQTVKPAAHGLESGRFMFSANPGEPLKSLVKTASGGEISRVLLALKAAEKKNKKLLHPLLVFDEVDAGIGGQTAHEVAKKLKKISEDSQLVVITHLHQIARLADHHLVAEKKTRKSRAVITVRALDEVGIEEELTRMLALPVEN
ncbi:MAG: DNA repair protein RecN [candidate division Zixibacteria bacterium]|nr:DNA repair protein RecN [candidate division Zixibacteria bacterium]